MEIVTYVATGKIIRCSRSEMNLRLDMVVTKIAEMDAVKMGSYWCI